MAETEDVTVPVLEAVSAMRGAFFYRQNTGTYRTMDGKRVVKVAPDGIADIMGRYFSQAVAIETKTAYGRLRTTQKRFRAAWERDGGIYIVARSPAEAVSALEALR